ncbi:Gfo/Idh/MocA family protein [Altererythrobacter lauratis]|uniref:Gfo/Idh/MocA family protein n=1 Tax=Alteraurantiacibacter lauratis TaxID=2054627 RepID=A0ABV7EEJ5_9SPHN
MGHALAIIGLGKIVRDQHLPALAGCDALTLAATVDPVAAALPGVPHFASVEAMFDAGIRLDAAAICTPPQMRAAIALPLLARGIGAFLEKPPAAGMAQAALLADAARCSGATLFTAWHSRMAAGVEPARQWLAGRVIEEVTITWREDVRQWHPLQPWIWQAGGMGVFDPGINALSILTAILPDAVMLEAARLEVPGNCQTPIAARLSLRSANGTPITADFDFRQEGEQTWRIRVDTDAGALLLDNGGAVLTLPGSAPAIAPDEEYPALYRRFAHLLDTGTSDFDLAPLALVADAFLLGEVVQVDDFHE